MDLLEKFKKVVDTIQTSVKVDGSPIIHEQIADRVGLSREYFSRLYNGKHPIRQKHIDDLILRFPEVTFTLNETNEPDSEKYHIQRRKVKQSKAGPTMVPFIPIKAQAGYVRAVDQQVYMDTLEKYALPPGVNPHGNVWAYWEVEGDSMLPQFREGDIILTSYVHPMDWENIRNFYTYVIITHDQASEKFRQRVLFKRLYCKNQLEWVLISDNEEMYPQQLIPVEDIKEVWVYRKTWSTRAEPPKMFEIKV